MTTIRPKYFIVNSCDSYLQQQTANVTTNTQFNDSNPLKRSGQLTKNSTASNDKYTSHMPFPRSCIPSKLSTNTCFHPNDIFYEMNKLDPIETNPPNRPNCIAQLNDYFCCDVLSCGSINKEAARRTYNKRFKNAKTNKFIPPTSNLVISELIHIQSLHLLSFSLNARMFLHFKMENYYFTLHLGPDDNANCDLHFLVIPVAVKVNVSSLTTSGKTVIKPKITRYIDLKLFNYDYFSSQEFTYKYGSFSTEGGDFLLLNLEGRDAIPYFKLIKPTDKTFTNITLDDQNNLSDKKTFSMSENGIMNVHNNCFQQCPKLSILKTLVTTLDPVEPSEKDTNAKASTSSSSKSKNITYLIAETNISGFFVKETSNTGNDRDLYQAHSFLENHINIVSYLNTANIRMDPNVYLNEYKFYTIKGKPITYGDILKSKHLLIFLLCYYGMIEILIKNVHLKGLIQTKDPAFGQVPYGFINIPQFVKPEQAKNPFLIFERIDNERSQIPKLSISSINKWIDNSNLYPPAVKNWLEISKIYPQIQIYSISTQDLITSNFNRILNLERDTNPEFGRFLFYIAQYSGAYASTLEKYHLVDRATIDQYLNCKDERSRFISQTIYNMYMESSQASCLYYFACQTPNPVNPELMTDVSTLDEFNARMTTKILKIDTVFVRDNAETFSMPVKTETFINKFKQHANEEIPDPPYAFKKAQRSNAYILQKELSKLGDNLPIISTSSQKPAYRYEFNAIMKNGKISQCRSFQILSQFRIASFYMSGERIFCLGYKNIKNSDEVIMKYGTCPAIDSEVRFSASHKVLSFTGVYIENDSCFIVYQILRTDTNETTSRFIGFDRNGKKFAISVGPKTVDFTIKAMAPISSTYFGAIDTDSNKHVFRYNGKTQTIEFNGESDMWHLKPGSPPDILLDKRKSTDSKHFIGSQNNSAVIFSVDAQGTLSSDQIESTNNSIVLDPDHSNNGNMNISINFKSESSYYKNNYVPIPLNEYEKESKFLEMRLKNPDGSNPKIESMLNCLPLSDIQSSVTNVNIALCELFPFLVMTNKKLIGYDSTSKNFYTYLFDHKIFASPSSQIIGYYNQTRSHVFLFSIEALFTNYKISNAEIVIIHESNGIGVRFANLLFGTRFDSREIQKNEIWIGYSLRKSGKNASSYISTIILLTTVDDIDNFVFAIEKAISRDVSDKYYQFTCKKDCQLNSITGKKYSSDGNSEILNIIFNSDLDLQTHVLSVQTKLNKFSTSLTKSALHRVKNLISFYSTFNQYQNIYDTEAIRKYLDLTPENQISSIPSIVDLQCQ